MARGMERFDVDTLADLPCRTMGRCFCDRLAIFTADHLQLRKDFELYGIRRVNNSRLRGASYLTIPSLPPAWSQWLHVINQHVVQGVSNVSPVLAYW